MKPTPFQILRYLPKTNCKECGYETCLAFATYIYAYGPSSLKKCPYISDDVIKQISDLFSLEKDVKKSVTMIELWEEFRKNLSNIDFKNFKNKKGFTIENDGITFNLLDEKIFVTHKDISSEKSNLSEHTKILIFYFLQCALKLEGEPEFHDYRSFYSKLKVRDVTQEEFEIKIQNAVRNELGKLKNIIESFGGREVSDYKDVYDLSMVVEIFPDIPVLILYRQGEEEFPPFCKLMFDKRCGLCFDSEGLEYLADYFAEKIIEKI